MEMNMSTALPTVTSFVTDNMSTILPDTTFTMTTMDLTDITVLPMNSTTPGCETSDIPFYWGFIAAGIAILFYGTNFAPVKKFDTGDGMFFQWVLCIAIWCCGLAVQVIRNSPTFYPLVMIGGVLWETGNICVVPIIKTIGLGLGLCIWGMTNLLSGWATGRFGLFGLHADPPDNIVLNDVGVLLAVSSAVIFAMVKNEVSSASVDHTVTVDMAENSPLLPSSINRSTIETETGGGDTFFDRLNPVSKRLFGIGLAAVSGLFYGQMFTPAIYIQDNYAASSQEALDYVFATFSGILATSTVYFLIYAAFTGNNPKVYPRAIMPGFVSGLMWGVATSSWFVANKVLSESVAFPIVSTGPGVVASILGVVVFKEIQGRRNIMILLLGMTVTITGSVLSGFSKKPKQC